LTYAGGRYDRTASLIEGDVRPYGIHLNYLQLSPTEAFWRMLQFAEFDASELSCANYLALCSRQDPRFVAIPVFPSRSFRHSAIYVSVSAGINGPADLRGRRVGVADYAMTTAVWVRGMLQDEYGVGPHELIWVEGGIEHPGHGRRLHVTLPPEIRIEHPHPQRPLLNMLEAGEIDALISPRVPTSLAKGSRKIARLFPDFAEAEANYYRRTGIFPIMHTVVLRRDILERHPWAAVSLYEAFCTARDRAMDRLYDADALSVSLAWLIHYYEEERHLAGSNDMWAYGFEPNRHVLETLKTYMAKQGLLEGEFSLDEAFAPGTIETPRV
jgi:4,5-dihydroxyphthalate decarboxylase